MRHPSLDDRFDPAIRIVPYDPCWPALAAAELARLAGELGPVAVRLEHIGSTAVPALAAKPVIDLQVSVADPTNRAAFADPLERLGYLFAPDDTSPHLHFFGLPGTRPRTHHVHVCAAGGGDEERHLAVRDFLRTRPQERRDYAAIKRRLSRQHPEDRIAYIEGKAPYVQELEGRALRWLRSS